jgi:hypothetical protein
MTNRPAARRRRMYSGRRCSLAATAVMASVTWWAKAACNWVRSKLITSFQGTNRFNLRKFRSDLNLLPSAVAEVYFGNDAMPA